MKRTSILLSAVLILAFVLSACQNAGGQATPVDENSFKTLVAGTLTAVALQAQQTLDAVPTETATPAPTFTPEPTFTPTKEIVKLTITQNTNCRKGSSTFFPVEVTLKAGSEVIMLGRNKESDYYYVQNPEDQTEGCWIWNEYATVTGNIEVMPVFTPMPTPFPTRTPTPLPIPYYTAAFAGLTNCTGGYGANFNIGNTGALPLESIRIILSVEGVGTFTHKSDSFTQWSAGAEYLKQSDLVKGESGIVTACNPGDITSDPTNLKVEADITICSKDALGGVCTNQVLNFMPH